MHIPVALYDVMKVVHHALKSAPGLASIGGIVLCHALPPVFACRAISGAPRPFLADINALVYVAKNALKLTVRFVDPKATLESTS